MYIDTHCHLSSKDYADIDFVLDEDRKNSVDKVIISGCSKESIKESLEYANKYSFVFVTIGFHPEEVDSITDEDIENLEFLIKSNKKVVGVGEIGLDYYYVKDNKDKQKTLFEKQLRLAEKLKLPVVIHSRDATNDTINILKKYHVKGIIHCFNGSIETANIYISMGYKLGIGGVVTFKNSNLFKVVKDIGVENIVLETDAPYLTPDPYRGKQNSSKYIPIIAQKIGDICEMSAADVGKVTSLNAKTVFDLP